VPLSGLNALKENRANQFSKNKSQMDWIYSWIMASWKTIGGDQIKFGSQKSHNFNILSSNHLANYACNIVLLKLMIGKGLNSLNEAFQDVLCR
jgi:hypothetical protein